jgi:hypothetical protein
MNATQLLIKEQNSTVISPHETVGRHTLDFYESPSWFTTELLRHVKLSGVIGEPCVGHGAIASLLQVWPYTKSIWTNDIDPKKTADCQLDAMLTETWEELPACDWICTNPPYADQAAPIIKNAFSKARVGVAAFLLTSFLEPCDDRAVFLQEHPPSLVLVMPRYCFRKDKQGKALTSNKMPRRRFRPQGESATDIAV